MHLCKYFTEILLQSKKATSGRDLMVVEAIEAVETVKSVKSVKFVEAA